MDERMFVVRSFTAASIMIAIGALPPLSSGSAIAQRQVATSDPIQVTTDTPEYCLYLLDRVSKQVRLAVIPVPDDVMDLTTEGHRMCATGQVRSGIARLRSALMIMEKRPGTTH